MTLATFNHIMLSLVALYIVIACLIVASMAFVGVVVTAWKKLCRPRAARPAWRPSYNRESQAGTWHAKFCWLPIKLDDDRWVWLCWICRARFSWTAPSGYCGIAYGRLWRRV